MCGTIHRINVFVLVEFNDTFKQNKCVVWSSGKAKCAIEKITHKSKAYQLD